MSQQSKSLKSMSLAIGATVATTLAASNIASAENANSGNPFAMSEMSSGYMLLADKGQEGKCGEGKCGAGKKADAKTQEGKCGEGKCGEGKCGSQPEDKGKNAEGKCGEGKCGGSR